jgi:tape measure domain-containing protein
VADGSIKIDTKIDTKGLPGELKKLGNVLTTGIGVAIKGATLAFGALATAAGFAVREASRIEDITAAFTPLTGGADNARKMIEALNKEAASTPFTLAGISNVAKQLLPIIGNDVGAVTETFRMLGDTAGGNMEKLDSITRGYVKTMNMGKVSMESLNMISDAGVPIQSLLAKNMGITVEELYSMVSAGEVTAAQLTDTFKTITAEGGLFYNGMQVASETLTGRISTMKDNFSALSVTIGEQLNPFIKSAVDALIDFAQWGTENNRIAGFLSKTIEFLGKVVSASFSFIKKAIGAVYVAWAQIVTFFETTGHKIGGFFKLIGTDIDVAFTTGFNGAKIAMISMYTYLTQKLLGGVKAMLDVLGKLPFVGEKFQAASAAVGNLSDAVGDSAEAAKRASAEKIAAAKAEQDAIRAGVDANIAAVKAEGQARIDAAKDVATAIEQFQFKPSGADPADSPIVTETAEAVEAAEDVVQAGAQDVTKEWWNGFVRGIKINVMIGGAAVKSAMQKIGTGMMAALSAISKGVSGAMSFISSLARFDPAAMLASLQEILDGITQFFMQDLGALPIYARAGMDAMLNFVRGLVDNMPMIAETATEVITELITMLMTHGPEILSAAVQIITVLAGALIENLPLIITAAIFLVTELILALAAFTPDIVAAIIDAIPLIIQALIESVPRLLAAAVYLAYKLIEGIINGIFEAGAYIWNGIATVFTDMWNAILAFFGVHSPSTEGVALGGNIIQGIIDGILSFGAGMWDAVSGVFVALWDSISGFFNGLFGWIDEALSAVGSAVSGAWDATVNFVGGVAQGVGDFFTGAVQGVVTVATDVGNWVADTAGAVATGVGNFFGGIGNWVTGLFASGTNSAPRGLAVVGEQGPELVQLGGGERIYPASQTAAILSAGAGAVAGLSAGGMGGMATIYNNLEAIVKIDEYEIGRAAYKTVDRFALA